MPLELAVWRIDGGLRAVAASGPDLEERLETLLDQDVTNEAVQRPQRPTRRALVVRVRQPTYPYVGHLPQLPQPVREAQGDPLEYIDQHVVVEGAVKLRFLGQHSLRALIEHDRGGVPVHR
jgi:hypothetical protein